MEPLLIIGLIALLLFAANRGGPPAPVVVYIEREDHRPLEAEAPGLGCLGLFLFLSAVGGA